MDEKKKTFQIDVKKYGMIIALVVITIFFQWTTKGVLLVPMNVSKLIMQNGYILILAIGMLLVILSGDIDLSVGSVMALVGAIISKMLVDGSYPVWLAILVGILVGLAIGAWQGFWIAFVKVPAFIATLAGMLLFRGLTLVITQGKTLGPFPNSYQAIAQAYLPDIPGTASSHLSSLLVGAILIIAYAISQVHRQRQEKAYGIAVQRQEVFLAQTAFIIFLIGFSSWWFTRFNGLPVILIILGVLVLFYSILTQNTVIGRHIYAIGGNAKAAELSGIKIRWVKFLTFVNMGLLAALAGIVYSARINCASPTAGDGFELDAIAACYIGGASAAGGIGTVSGAIVGGLVMGILNNGMSIMGVGTDWQKAIKGLVLLAAVVFDVLNQKKKR